MTVRLVLDSYPEGGLILDDFNIHIVVNVIADPLEVNIKRNKWGFSLWIPYTHLHFLYKEFDHLS